MATAAYTMPGRFTSIPKVLSPRDFAAESSRAVAVPNSANSAVRLSVTRDGRCATASAATSPKRRRIVPHTTTPWSTRQVAASTPSRAAAAATSDARADAPASRMGIQQSRTLDDPPVIMTPSSRIVFAVIHFTLRMSVLSRSG